MSNLAYIWSRVVQHHRFTWRLAAALLLSVAVLAARGQSLLPPDALIRARVRVMAGLADRTPCVVTCSLDGERVALLLPGGVLPKAMSAQAVELPSGEATSCSVAVRPADPASQRRASLDVSFRLTQPLAVMASRDVEITLRSTDAPAPSLEGPTPLATLVPLETRLLHLEVAGKGEVYALDEASLNAAVPYNGGFDADTFQTGSAAAGWIARPFQGAGDIQLRRETESIDGRENRFGRISQTAGYVGFISSPFAVQGGTRYRISLRSRGEAGGKTPSATALNVVLRLTGPQGDDLRARRWEVNWPDLPLSASWTGHDRVVPTPHGACWGFLIVRAGAGKQLDIDDVRIEPIASLPAATSFETAEQFLPPRSDREEASSQDVVWDASAPGLILRPVTNLIADGGFEADGAWVFSHPQWIERSDEMKWSGTRALRFKSPGGTQHPPIVTATRSIELDTARPHVLSLVYSARNGGAVTRVRMETETGAILVDDVLPAWFTRPGDGWMRRRLLIPAGKGTAHAGVVRATLSLIHETGKANPTFIDDVCLNEGAEAAPFGDGPTRVSEGVVVSSIVDLGAANAPAIEWSAVTPPGTTLQMWTRCGPTPYHDPSSWDHWRPVTSGEAMPTLGRGMDGYVQWKAVLGSDRPDATPVLQRVTLRRGASDVSAASPLVRLTALDNGDITVASTDWLAQIAREAPLDEWMKSPEFAVAAEAAKHAVEPFTDDFDRQQALLHYFTNHITVCYGGKAIEKNPDKFDAAVFGRWIEGASRGQGNVVCSHFGVMYCAMLRAVGMPGRMMSLGGFAGAGHDMSEVWSDRYQKWYFADSQYGGILIRDGIPQSLQDVQELYLRGTYHELRTQMSAQSRSPHWRLETGWGNMSPVQYVGRENKDCKADILLSHALEWTEHRLDLAQWYAPPDYLFMNDPYYREPGDGKKTFTSGTFSDPQRLRFKVNQVQLKFDRIDDTQVNVRLQHNGLDFDHYELTLNGQPHDLRDDHLAWTLIPGKNHLTARTVSRQGHRGKAFTADLWRETNAAER